ncbi:nucleotidyltransferase family protein [Sphingobium sufflavum]|uniref:nucleotidyltransferase family protein n=1 Tax=Sphingobium sufflavum TaxID=1129547 RepID=UPI001F282F6B|nr:nucleotidyltransferase family protein [Sphingobium sufflavum]MCE7795758.1 nucleotidyltransferase family protein [Sphingobium sufflavum]
MTDLEFKDDILRNRVNGQLLARLPELGLPDCLLTAGCLFQAVWNRLSGQAADWGVQDYDLFYHDDRDLSWEAEDRVIRRVADAMADLPVRIETRNQARVHLWYPARFGSDYPQLPSSRAGIDRYLIACTCVGIDVQNGALYTPNGLDDLAAGRLDMNPLHPKPELFRQKAESYRRRWPWLTIAA